MLKGGCFCGAVRYEAGGEPDHATVCHCSICRRTTGAPFVAWFTVPREEFRVVKGRPVRFRSSGKGTRAFCGRCGTQLTFEDHALPLEIDVTTASLDHPGRLPPQDQVHAGSRLAWVPGIAALPEFREGRVKP